MNGRFVIEIGARSDGVNDFLNGMSTGPEVNDGGYSSDTTSGNFITKPGVLLPPGPITNRSTNLTGELICSAEDPTYTGSDRVFLDDEQAFYTFSGTTLTKQVTAAATGGVTLGTTDMVPWFNSVDNARHFYATTSAGANGDIIRWDKSTSTVNDWWTNASHRNQAALSAFTAYRPLLVYEKNLYIGDGNRLHRVLPDHTTTNSILVLTGRAAASDVPLEVISALGIDNNTGYMLIATTTSVDYSASRNGRSRIYYYDGFSNKAVRVAETNGTITSFLPVGSATYVFYGNKMGIFTGSGIRFLRQFRFAIGDATDLIYKHRQCVVDDTVYIAEKNSLVSAGPTTILAYGPLRTAGPNVFYPVSSPDTSTAEMTLLCPVGGNSLGYSYATDKFYTYSLTSVASTAGLLFRSNWYRFPRPVNLYRIVVEFETAISAGTEGICTIQIEDDTNTTTTIKSVTQLSGVTQAVVTTPTVGMKTRAFRLKFTNAPETPSNVFGVRRFLVYYDYAE